MNNSKYKLYLLFIIITGLAANSTGCATKNFIIESYKTGSNLDPNGHISDRNLTFRFRKPDNKRYVKDLFNYIYFEGDTVCFSIIANKKISSKKVTIKFINPATGKSFPAERVETKNNIIYGFSLLGSILEEFFKNRLDSPIPDDAFCCKEIPFIIEVSMDNKGKTFVFKFKGNFKIEYI